MKANLNAVISARILAHVANGMNVRDAYDAVFGAGACSKMIGNLYEDLREKAAAAEGRTA